MISNVDHFPTWQKTITQSRLELWRNHHTHPRKRYLFVGGVHGDEPEGVNLALSLLERLESHESDCEWILIPCLNPDGYKNQTRTNSRGVDLNRNFPSRDWQAVSAGPRYNPGTSSASEMETQALVGLLLHEKFDVIFHFHSWKPEVIVTGPENLPEAEVLSRASGHPVKMDIGYPTPGSLGQYGWFDCKTPVICIEEEEKVSRAQSWKKFGPAFEQILGLRT